MRISVVCSEPGPVGGGVGVVAEHIIRALSPDHDVTVHVHQSKKGRLERRIRFAAVAADVLQRQPELTLYTHLDLARLEAVLGRVTQRRYALFVHGWEAWRPLSKTRRHVVEHAWKVLANSQTTVELATEANPWWPQTRVTHLGVDGLISLDPVQQRRPIALIVGRMDASERLKGHDLVLDAWPEVTHASAQAELWIAGDGNDENRLKQRAATEGLKNVRFLGFVSQEEKARLLSTARVFLFPSRQEGFGLAAVEAALAGVPVVALRNTVLEEVFAKSGGAYFADAPDGHAVAAQMLPLMASDTLAQQVGTLAREWVRNKYLYEHFAARFKSALFS